MEKLAQLIKMHATKNQKKTQIEKIKKKVEKAIEKIIPVTKERKIVSAGIENHLKAALNPLYSKYDVHIYAYSTKNYILKILAYSADKRMVLIDTKIKIDVYVNTETVNDALEAVNFYGLGLHYVHQTAFIELYNQDLGADVHDKERNYKLLNPELF
jgi:hypothetical protein